MTLDLSAGGIVQALVVAGLGGTAKVLFDTVIELGKLGTRVDGHEKRLDRLDDRGNE